MKVTTWRLRQLADELTDRYTAPLAHLERARVLTGVHLGTLTGDPGAAPATVARVRRRIMARLADTGLVNTLDRRIGGIHAGSAGHVYVLTSAGHRFLALRRGHELPPRIRHATAPGAMFLAHALAVSGIYVDLVVAARHGRFRLVKFVTEPDSWWQAPGGPALRPDAYLVVANSRHRDAWWLEVDQDTESLPRLRAKLTTYATCTGPGPDGATPRLLVTAPAEQRADAITATIDAVTETATAMIAVTTHQQAANLLVTELHTN